MYWRETATLIKAEKTDDADGYTSTGEKGREVFVDKQSVKRQEFYAARQSGDRLDVVFKLRAADYDGETIVEHDGKRYNVVRAYTRAGEFFELNCVEIPKVPTTASQEPASGPGKEGAT